MLERWTANPFQRGGGGGGANVIRGTLIRLLNVPVMAADFGGRYTEAHTVKN